MTGPFIKFFPSDFLGGTSGLSPAERGVYITLLCLMFEHDGPIPRHDARLARRCGSPKAGFIRLLQSLIDEGKIIERDGELFNNRAEKAITDRRNRSQNATIAANSKWDAQREKTQQKQASENAPAPPTQCVADAKPEARVQKKEERDKSLSEKERETQREIVDAYNAIALRLGIIKRAVSLTDKRAQALRARMRDHDPPAILEAIAAIERSAFLRGDRGQWNGATISFLLRTDTITRILEGDYDDAHQPEQRSSAQREEGDGFDRAIRRRLNAGEAEGNDGSTERGRENDGTGGVVRLITDARSH